MNKKGGNTEMLMRDLREIMAVLRVSLDQSERTIREQDRMDHQWEDGLNKDIVAVVVVVMVFQLSVRTLAVVNGDVADQDNEGPEHPEEDNVTDACTLQWTACAQEWRNEG